jgi:hypothetical protein
VRLAENVLHFARVLRGAGLAVGTDRVLEAVQVLPIAGVRSRSDWHATLSALFLTRHEQQPVFDEAFAAFWRDPAFEERMMALLLPKVRGKTAGLAERARPRVAEAFLPPATISPAGEAAEDEVVIDAALTFAPGERLRRLDFEKMTLEEWNAAKEAVRRMRLPLPEVRTRRHRRSARGRVIDLPATLRGMARSGGQGIDLVRREPGHRLPPLVVLCDISGSMHRYTRMFLHFLHALQRDRGQVTTFLFGTRLTHVARQLHQRDADEAVEAVCAAVPDWAGGTRIATCLREFNFRWSRRLLGRSAGVLLVTDGLERDESGALAEEMARLHRACRPLIWLNPLLRYEGFSPSATGIAAMRPHVDAFLPAHNLESLESLSRRLAS